MNLPSRRLFRSLDIPKRQYSYVPDIEGLLTYLQQYLERKLPGRNVHIYGPNYLLGGVYCLVAGDNVIYVGQGNSRGGGIYKERGLSRRLEAHVLDLAPKGKRVAGSLLTVQED